MHSSIVLYYIVYAVCVLHLHAIITAAMRSRMWICGYIFVLMRYDDHLLLLLHYATPFSHLFIIFSWFFFFVFFLVFILCLLHIHFFRSHKHLMIPCIAYSFIFFFAHLSPLSLSVSVCVCVFLSPF